MKNQQKIIDEIIEKMELVPHDNILYSIRLYKLVRKLYVKDINVLSNVEFCWAYSNYYGLALHYKKEDLNTYFTVLQRHLYNNSVMDIDDIVKELSTAKNQYVFASKLMNFVDDGRYPIIDRNVSSIFGFKSTESCSVRYRAIYGTYLKLIDNIEVKAFISKFPFDGIGIMKVLDIIVWNIAKLPNQ